MSKPREGGTNYQYVLGFISEVLEKGEGLEIEAAALMWEDRKRETSNILKQIAANRALVTRLSRLLLAKEIGQATEIVSAFRQEQRRLELGKGKGD